MKRRRKYVTILLALALLWGVLVCLRHGMSRHDYERVKRGGKPTFAWHTWSAGDGGSNRYRGLGYDLTAQHRFRVEDGWPVGYDQGPILKYRLNWLLLPLSDKKEITFVPSHGLAQERPAVPGQPPRP